jgi:NADPH:quinone reductase-like Zn-dependent oxidoreductase
LPPGAASALRNASRPGYRLSGLRKTAVAFIRRGFDEGKLKPVIDRVFRFDEIVEAHRYLEASNQFGKIVATL